MIICAGYVGEIYSSKNKQAIRFQQAVRRFSGCDLSTADMSSDISEDHSVCTTVIATHLLHATDDGRRLLSRLSLLLDREAAESTIVLVEPAPFNDTVQLLNEVARFFNCFRIHHGAPLRKANMGPSAAWFHGLSNTPSGR